MYDRSKLAKNSMANLVIVTMNATNHVATMAYANFADNAIEFLLYGGYC